jgi:hypothetical protein
VGLVFPSSRRIDGSQIQSGSFGEELTLLSPPEKHFSLKYTFRPNYGSGVDSASNTNEYQEYFLWGKGDRFID